MLKLSKNETEFVKNSGSKKFSSVYKRQLKHRIKKKVIKAYKLLSFILRNNVRLFNSIVGNHRAGNIKFLVENVQKIRISKPEADILYLILKYKRYLNLNKFLKRIGKENIKDSLDLGDFFSQSDIYKEIDKEINKTIKLQNTKNYQKEIKKELKFLSE